jgi:RNA polymerase sigma-70 factor (ECF subfamily)
MDKVHTELRDAKLVQAGLKGDREAIGELIKLYQKPLYNIAYRILSDRDAAADATQMAFLLAIEKLDSFDPQYKFFSWIYRIAINEALGQDKKRRRFVAYEPPERLLPTTAGPEADMNKVEVAETIKKAIGQLQEDYRTVIILRHFSELSYEEIASVLSISVKTVRSRLYSARQVLKTELSDAGVVLHG